MGNKFVKFFAKPVEGRHDKDAGSERVGAFFVNYLMWALVFWYFYTFFNTLIRYTNEL